MDSDKDESTICSFRHDLVRTQCQLETISFKILKEDTEKNLDSDKEESKVCSFTHDLDPKKKGKSHGVSCRRTFLMQKKENSFLKVMSFIF